MNPPKKFIDRIMAKCVEQQPPNDPLAAKVDGPCWVWTGHLNPQGYGVVREHYRSPDQRVHRVTFGAVSTLPSASVLDHLCRNRACCNPAHLEIVTQGENVRRGRSKICRAPETKRRVEYRARMRTLRANGSSHGWREFLTPEELAAVGAPRIAKLSMADAELIRTRHAGGETRLLLAEAFGVSRTMIDKIVRGKAWAPKSPGRSNSA